jgi:hypothetical protein
VKHKRQQLTALSLYQQSYTFRKQIFRKSSNTQETAFKVGRQLLPQIAKHSHPYHRFSRYNSHRFYFYLTEFFSILFSWYFKLHEYWHQAKIHEGMHMHLRTTNAGECICAYDQYAHMQGVNVNLQKRINEETVIKTDDYKHRDQTKYRNSCMYIIGLYFSTHLQSILLYCPYCAGLMYIQKVVDITIFFFPFFC